MKGARALSAALLLALPATSHAQMTSGSLCFYSIAVSLKSFQENCLPEREEDAAFLAEMLPAFRAHVQETGGWQQDRIQSFESQMRGDGTDPEMCDREDLLQFFDAVVEGRDGFVDEAMKTRESEAEPHFGVCL